MSFGIPVRNGLGVGLLASTFLSSLRIGGRPAMFLDFIGTNSLDSRVTFTRATTATFVGSNGFIQTAAINAPRFDYNPATLAPKGLLIEESRANALTYGNDFNNVIWTKTNCSIVLAGTSPDGTANTNVLVENSASGNHWFFTANAVVGSYTLSVYAKPDTRNWLVMRVTLATGNAIAFFNVSTGAIGTVAAGLTATITPAGNGFYRCSISGTLVVGAVVIGAASADGVASYAGNSGNALGLYGAQLEAGAFATSYIPTTLLAVTRNADVASMTGTNFSSWYNANEGTFAVAFSVLTIANPNGVSPFSAYVSSNNLIRNWIFPGVPSTPRGYVNAGGANVADMTNGTIAANTPAKTALAYKVNDYAFSLNGNAPATDTSGAVPTGLTTLYIGSTSGGADIFSGHIRSLAYYNTRLPDTSLRTLSA
jgi:hypothetical protein